MRKLELNQMENLEGGFSLEKCLFTGMAMAIHLSVLGPWGFLGGLVGGCAAAQL